LMGFERKGKPFNIRGVSDTQLYRQFGNAVVVPVVEAVAQCLKPHLAKALATEHQTRALGRRVANG
jgi:DNA (cytosine-5)-methyltransferase 1